eukprot:9323110-Heterocapsa_arctica.AAC.1
MGRVVLVPVKGPLGAARGLGGCSLLIVGLCVAPCFVREVLCMLPHAACAVWKGGDASLML